MNKTIINPSFQFRVCEWMQKCFGLAISMDGVERNHRFLEESLELVQALGCTRSEAHQLVDYVFDRPAGDALQEAGGVLVTLAALCSARAICMAAAGETELDRVWTKIEKIRAKQAEKPKHSPLPETPASAITPAMTMEHAREIVGKCNRHVWYREGLTDDLPPTLADYTLQELVTANHMVAAENQRARKAMSALENIGSKDIQVVCDDRLIAALYAVYHYPGQDHRDCQPVAAADGKAIVVVKVKVEGEVRA